MRDFKMLPDFDDFKELGWNLGSPWGDLERLGEPLGRLGEVVTDLHHFQRLKDFGRICGSSLVYSVSF